jgi:glycosyltransferase involved in cell wall biosynthesis
MTRPAPAELGVIVTRFIAGAGGVALRGALGLDPDRYRVTVVTGEGGPLLERARDAGLEIVLEPALVPDISPRSDALALHRLTELCASRHFDIVHTHSSKAGALGRLAAHRARVPVVAHTFHGFPFHEFQSRLRRASYISAERRLAQITDVTFAIGSAVAAEAVRRRIASTEGLRTIMPVVEEHVVRRTPASRKAARALLGIPDDVPLIGTVGRVDFQKAPEHLVEAASRLRHRDAEIVWIGGGPGLDEAQALVTRLGLVDRFHFVGERGDVADVLPALDIFVMASRYEGLPCALVEAMRCGLPVVATTVNSVPDLVAPGETGLLVPPARPAALACALDHLLDHPSVADRLAAMGQAAADSRFDTDRLGLVLDEAFTERLSVGRWAARP